MIEPIARRLGRAHRSRFRRPLRARGAFSAFEERRRAARRAHLRGDRPPPRGAPTSTEREDVLSLLLQARDEDGRPLTDAELRDELVTLLVAGHETTATGLAWAFELLPHNPRVLDAAARVARRGRRRVPRRGGQGDAARAPGDPRRRAAWCAASRSSSAATRSPRAWRSTPRSRSIHRRGDRYPQPREFRPERFLGDGRARHLHVAPVRRRHAPLPGRRVRDLRDGDRDPDACSSAATSAPPRAAPRSWSAAASRSSRATAGASSSCSAGPRPSRSPPRRPLGSRSPSSARTRTSTPSAGSARSGTRPSAGSGCSWWRRRCS